MWQVKKQFKAKYPSLIPEDIPGQYSSLRYKQEGGGSALNKSSTKRKQKLVPIKIGEVNNSKNMVSPNQILESENSKSVIHS